MVHTLYMSGKYSEPKSNNISSILSLVFGPASCQLINHIAVKFVTYQSYLVVKLTQSLMLT